MFPTSLERPAVVPLMPVSAVTSSKVSELLFGHAVYELIFCIFAQLLAYRRLADARPWPSAGP